MRFLTLTLLSVVFIFTSACAGGTATPEPTSDIQSVPKAWIDSPLDGMTFTLEEIQIISHTTDLTGIARVELSVNNQVVRVDENPASSQSLFVISQPWTPTQPGQYLLQVRGQTTNGTWSNYATVTINIIAPTATPAFTPTATLTSTPSLTPTPTATDTPLPTNTPTIVPTVSRPIMQAPGASDNELYNVPGCGAPSEVEIRVQITNVTKATLFYSIGGSEWFSQRMINTNGNRWAATIASDPAFGSYIGEIEYYIRAENEVASVDSPHYGGITMLNCKP